jgi:outer membrane protein assembly factor BamB
MKMKLTVKLFAVAAILLSLVSTTVMAQDWPQFSGTNRDGKVTGFKAPQTWPAALKQEWKVTVGLADATPALVNNKLYVFTNQSGNEILLCLDAATGKQIWQSVSYPAVTITGPAASHPGPRSTPTVAEGKVVAVGVAGDIACFDAANGKLLWRNEELKGAVPSFFTSMSPIVTSGTCIAHLGGPKDGKFIAFDLASGNVIWKIDGEAPYYSSPVLINLDGTKQAVFQTGTKLVSLNIKDGAKLWEFATPIGEGRISYSSSPVANKQTIYFTGLNNGVNAIEIKKQADAYSVNKLWTNSEITTTFNTPVLKDGFLYGLSSKSRLFCINASNGQTAWIDDAPQQGFGTIVDAGSILIALSSTSNLVVFKPDGKAYSQIASIKVSESPVYAQPVLSGNRIFIKDNDSLTEFTVK